jgi:hypothetical protein
MATNTALRLYDTISKRPYIVEGDKVYAARDDGMISRKDVLFKTSDRYGAMIAAAAYFNDIFLNKMPGNTTPSGEVVSGATLDQVELAQFAGSSGTKALRPALEHHLSHWDPEGKGSFGLIRNYRGWRQLPCGPSGDKFTVTGAMKQAAGSWGVFTFRRFQNAGAGVLGSIIGAASTLGRLDIHSINQSRWPGSTGIYDKFGNIDEAKWAVLEAGLRKVADESGTVPLETAKAVLADIAPKLGFVAGRQWESFWLVATGMNRANTVTIDQFRWNFDGSLMERARRISDERHGEAPEAP